VESPLRLHAAFWFDSILDFPFHGGIIGARAMKSIAGFEATPAFMQNQSTPITKVPDHFFQASRSPKRNILQRFASLILAGFEAPAGYRVSPLCAKLHPY
jgi:hypothetical protein